MSKNLPNTTDTITISSEDAKKLQRMAESFTDLQEQLAKLQEQVKQQNVNSIVPPSSNPYPLSFLEPIIANPELFNGSTSQIDTFITQVKLTIQVQPSRFATDRQKVLFTSSFFRGHAAKWFQPIFTQKTLSPLLDNFDQFINELNTSFGGINDAYNAVFSLTHLAQSHSVSNYAAEFKRLAPYTNWNDAALSYQFYQGLKSSTKDELARCPRPNSLEDLIQVAISIDNRIQERFLEKATNQPRRYYQSVPNVVHPQYSDKMEIDTIRPPRVSQPRAPLSNKERQHRLDNKLCLYCGQPNHMVSTCPLRQKTTTRPSQVAAVINHPAISDSEQGNFYTQCQ